MRDTKNAIAVARTYVDTRYYVIEVTRYAFITVVQVHTNPDMEYCLPTY